MIFTFEDYRVEIETEKMKTIADRKTKCECASCRIWREYTSTLSDDVKDQFHALGIDIESPDEVFDIEKDDNGNVQYGGWWNLCGKITHKGSSTYKIADGFEVTFSEDKGYVPKCFEDSDTFQMKFAIRGNYLGRLGKEYEADDGTSPKNTFIYHISDEAAVALESFCGGEVVRIDGADKRQNISLYVKLPDKPELRKLSLNVSRDIDTCHDGIDRMVLSASVSSASPNAVDVQAEDGNIACPRECIKNIVLFESTIEGAMDKVIYDSHLMLEFISGRRMIFRAEPDGEEVISVFADVDDLNIENCLRVSDTWFVHPELCYDEKGEIIGLKHFYKTETTARFVFRDL